MGCRSLLSVCVFALCVCCVRCVCACVHVTQDVLREGVICRVFDRKPDVLRLAGSRVRQRQLPREADCIAHRVRLDGRLVGSVVTGACCVMSV